MATANNLNRPRPPSGRRKSSFAKGEGLVKTSASDTISPAHEEEVDENILPPNLLPSPPLPSKSKTRTSNHSANNVPMKMERDLELDLPFDFAAALGQSTHFWPQRARKTSANDYHSREGSYDSMSNKSETASPLGGSLSRVLGTRAKIQIQKPGSLKQSRKHHPASGGRTKLDSLFQPSSEALHDAELHSELRSEEERTTETSSEPEDTTLDADWVGDLPREELEILLMQANQVIKERERDLGIAAAIGKALLEKNISLRGKHEGILTRLSSVASFSSQQFDVGGSYPTSSYSPPTTDTSINDETQKDMTSNEYTSPRKRMQAFSQIHAATPDNRLRSSNSRDYFVASQPPTPDGRDVYDNHERSLAHVQFSNEAQRQLQMLSEQNETLLEQLSLLQQEAEDAKKAGGKRLKKLNREIDGLRNELEAATERNVELEKVAGDDDHFEEDSPSGRTKRVWKRRGSPWKESSDNDPDASRQSSSTVRGSNGSDPVDEFVDQRQGSHHAKNPSTGSISARSDSVLSTASHSLAQSDPERALVAQLLIKIQELEETNASLAIAGTEMDGRIGKAMEEGERIRDAYEGLENVSYMNTDLEDSRLQREDSEIFETHFSGSPLSSANTSPVTRRKRRAPGNRYIIEGRKTLRAALRKERGLLSEGFGFSRNNDSPYESPIKTRERDVGLRPSILITPSCDDLRTRSKKAAEWQEDDSYGKSLESTPPSQRHNQQRGSGRKRLTHKGSLGNFSSVSSLSSVTDLPHQFRRSLASELESLSPLELQRRGSISDNEEQPLTLYDLRQNATHGSIVLHSRASVNSLRAASEAESDVADLKWSVSSDTTVQGRQQQLDPADELAIATIPQQDRTIMGYAEEDDGNWHASENQELIPKGHLKLDLNTSHESYERIERATKRIPLHWADDEDFGKPITERDARQLGLLEGSPQNRRRHLTLLNWIQGKRPSQSKGKGKGKAKSAHQVESSEAVQERQKLEELLRAKRMAALQSRVTSGQISWNRAYEMGAYSKNGVEDHPSIEVEVTVRALAYSSAHQRKRQSQLFQAPSRRKSVSEKEQRRSLEEEEDFELLDLDPKKRERGGKRGTDYYPVTLIERYKPKVVKQRMNQMSTEAITWASAWATFSLVMVFAFLVTFSRGPKKVLNGQKK